jgi:hypothetical protein
MNVLIIRVVDCLKCKNKFNPSKSTYKKICDNCETKMINCSSCHKLFYPNKEKTITCYNCWKRSSDNSGLGIYDTCGKPCQKELKSHGEQIS